MEILLKLNPGHLAILTVLLNFLGWIIKSIPKIPNYWIPLVLGVAGSVAHCVLAGWTGENALLGICAAAIAVYGHQFTRSLIDSAKANPVPPAVPLVALCLVLFSGCATGQDEGITPAKVERSLNSAVGIYATIEIRENPESRVKFESALLALNTLVSQERWDVAAFGEVLAATGATKLSGDEIVLIVQAAGALVELTGKGEAIDLSKVEYARAVILAGQKALTRVLSRP